MILLSAWLKPHSAPFLQHITVVNKLFTVILGTQRMVTLGNAANVVMQPLTSQRGGHCLLHAEITLPYQFSVEL